MGKCLDILIGSFGGMIVGALVALLVNNSLLEISINPFFSIIFGISLLFMGMLILYRVNSLHMGNNQDGAVRKKSMSTYFVIVFACFVFLAGVFCFLLEKNWFHGLSPMAKVPMYSLLGIALWFALTFSIMDLINFIGQYIFSKLCKGRRTWQPLVSTPLQILVVLATAVCLGLFFGIVFGTLDVEDDTSSTFIKRSEEASYTFPVAMVACGVVGALNQAYLRPSSYSSLNQEEEYNPKTRGGYDDGI